MGPFCHVDRRQAVILTRMDGFRHGHALCKDGLAPIKDAMPLMAFLPRLLFRRHYGPEFNPNGLGQWACLNGVELGFIRPGKPADNAFIEVLNGRFRQECLNKNRFLSVDDTMQMMEPWRNHYSAERPHNALGNQCLREFSALSEIAG